jgi:hypothetical protein
MKTAVTNDNVFATQENGNCDGIPARSQPITFSIKSTVFLRSVKAPNEKRIKSGLANNCAIASTSSRQKERKMRRSVCNCMIRPGLPRCSRTHKVDRLLRRRSQSPQAQDVWRSIAANALKTTHSTVAASQHTIRAPHSIQIKDARTERGIRTTSATARYVKSSHRARGSSSVHCMSFAQASDPNCLWRRSEARSDDADWRTAGRL